MSAEVSDPRLVKEKLISTLTSVSLTLSTLTIICPQELAKSRKEVAQLTTEVEQLHREKADLVGEVKTHKSRVRPSYVNYDQSKVISTIANVEHCGMSPSEKCGAGLFYFLAS